MEYFHRTRQFNFLGMDSRRAKLDRYQNRWSLDARKDLLGLEVLAEAYGYDPAAPPVDAYILLHCEPNKGAYEIACVDIEKAQEAYRGATKQIAVLDPILKEHRRKGRQDKAVQIDREMDRHKEAKDKAAQRFQECRAVLDNAIQRFYLVPVDMFEKMDAYGMPLHCQSLTVVPQKKHQDLPDYQPASAGLLGPEGETVFPEAGLPEPINA